MTYDHWKTTDPADVNLGNTMSKDIRLQCAADDAAVIAEEIECLCNLLDRYDENYGVELADRFAELSDINKSLVTRVAKYARSLEPVED